MVDAETKDFRLIAYRARFVAFILLFVAGLAFAAYPFLSNFYYEQKVAGELEELAAAVAKGDPEAYRQELESARIYNQDLVGQTVPDVFAIREGTTDATYEGYLNVLGNQMMGSLRIPVIGVNLPIYHYSTEESLIKGVGHIFGSSLPVGGESSHAVLTAHRGLPSAKLFTDLDQVQKGDRFFVRVLNETMAYEVEHIEVVKPSETRSLAIKRGEDLVTLVTCTPYGSNTDRLLVRGHRIPYEPGDEDQPTRRHFSQMVRALMQVLCALLGVGLAWTLLRMRARRGEEGPGPGNRPNGGIGGIRRRSRRGGGLFYD